MFPRLSGHFSPWMRSTLQHDKVIKWTKAKVHVYSDSFLCLGKMHEHSEAHAKWRDQLQDCQQSNAYRKSRGIDGEPVEFEWTIFPGLTTLEILQTIQENPDVRRINPEQSDDRNHRHVSVQRY